MKETDNPEKVALRLVGVDEVACRTCKHGYWHTMFLTKHKVYRCRVSGDMVESMQGYCDNYIPDPEKGSL